MSPDKDLLARELVCRVDRAAMSALRHISSRILCFARDREKRAEEVQREIGDERQFRDMARAINSQINGGRR